MRFTFITLLFLFIAHAAFAANETSNSFDKVTQGRSTVVDKDYVFNIGAGSANPRIRANATTGKMQFSNDGTTFSDVGSGSGTTTVMQPVNCTITASVAANALTVALKDSAGADPTVGSACVLPFRSSTLGAGSVNYRTVSTALSVVASSGSTLGHTNAVGSYVFVYGIDTGSGVVLAISSQLLDEGLVFSSTAEGGAGAADSFSALYSTAAQTSKPIKLLGRLFSTQATAGTWATAPSEISNVPFISRQPHSYREYTGTPGWGSTNTTVRYWTTSTGQGTDITEITNNSTLGLELKVETEGRYCMFYMDTFNTANTDLAITRNTPGGLLSTSPGSSSFSAAYILGTNRANIANAHYGANACRYLYQNDRIRPMSGSPGNGTDTAFIYFYMEKID